MELSDFFYSANCTVVLPGLGCSPVRQDKTLILQMKTDRMTTSQVFDRRVRPIFQHLIFKHSLFGIASRVFHGLLDGKWQLMLWLARLSILRKDQLCRIP